MHSGKSGANKANQAQASEDAKASPAESGEKISPAPDASLIFSVHWLPISKNDGLARIALFVPELCSWSREIASAQDQRTEKRTWSLEGEKESRLSTVNPRRDLPCVSDRPIFRSSSR